MFCALLAHGETVPILGKTNKKVQTKLAWNLIFPIVYVTQSKNTKKKETQMSCKNEQLLACNQLHKPSGGKAIAQLVVVYGPYMN